MAITDKARQVKLAIFGCSPQLLCLFAPHFSGKTFFMVCVNELFYEQVFMPLIFTGDKLRIGQKGWRLRPDQQLVVQMQFLHTFLSKANLVGVGGDSFLHNLPVRTRNIVAVLISFKFYSILTVPFPWPDTLLSWKCESAADATL